MSTPTVTSYSVKVILKKGSTYVDPFTTINIALLDWGDSAHTALVNVSAAAPDTKTINGVNAPTGTNFQVGTIQNLLCSVQFGQYYPPDAIEVTIVGVPPS